MEPQATRRGADNGPAAHAARPVLDLCGEVLVPDVTGALWWPDAATLLVADLHLEKGSAHAVRGAMLPPYDTAATLALLERVIVRYRPRRIVAVGDSFHDLRAGNRLAEPDRTRLAGLQEKAEWLWIAGNHDPRPPIGIGGTWHSEIAIGPLVFRHEPTSGGDGEIAGHLHPVAKVQLKGRMLRRRCFIGDGRRLVLPAFGAFTGGLNVLDAAFAGLFCGRAFDAWLIGARAVYLLSGRRLIA